MQAGLELPESRNSPVCPKSSWFPQRRALLCPELAPLRGDRASLAARPDRLWGGVARKPEARIPFPQGHFQEDEARPEAFVGSPSGEI